MTFGEYTEIVGDNGHRAACFKVCSTKDVCQVLVLLWIEVLEDKHKYMHPYRSTSVFNAQLTLARITMLKETTYTYMYVEELNKGFISWTNLTSNTRYLRSISIQQVCTEMDRDGMLCIWVHAHAEQALPTAVQRVFSLV